MELRFGPLVFIQGTNSGRYPYCHSLFVDAGHKVLIDPGSDRERLGQLRESSKIDSVWLSHGHEDHFKDLDLFGDYELWVPEADARPLEDLDSFLDIYGMTHRERQFYHDFMIHDFHFMPRTADRLFRGTEVIDLGGVTVEVIPTPGHTPGHCSFFFPEPQLLFLGDYDLTPFGPWYGDVKSDLEATIASINHLRSIPAKIWISSHETGVFQSEPGELWDRYLHTIDQREAKLLDVLRTPRTMLEIIEANILYGKKREPQEFYSIGERGHMGKHLERLIKQGIVLLEDGTYRRA